jgi:hypothetical protein
MDARSVGILARALSVAIMAVKEVKEVKEKNKIQKFSPGSSHATR